MDKREIDFDRLSPEGLQKAGELLARVYRSDPSVLSFMDGVAAPKQDHILQPYFELLVRLGLKYGVVLRAREGTALVGVAIIYPPGHYPVPVVAQWSSFFRLITSLMPAIGLGKFLKLLGVVRALEAKHPKVAHYYGEITCVDPNFQKRGIGTYFTKELLDWADRDGVGTYIETSNPGNLPLWKKLGFKVASEQEIGGVRYTSMWRETTRFDTTS